MCTAGKLAGALAMATPRRPAMRGCLRLLQKASLLVGVLALSAVAAASSPAGAVSGSPCPNVFFPLPLLGCARASVCSASRLLLARQCRCSASAVSSSSSSC